MSITLHSRARVVVTTPQGSTKIYKADGKTGSGSSNDSRKKSQQTLNVEIGHHAGICYLPDPSVPFENSRYEQVQRFTVIEAKNGEVEDGQQSSLCVLDWVTQGRSARGEDWSFHSWKGRNEVWLQYAGTGRRLLLRDSVILEDEMSHKETGYGENDAPPSHQRREDQSPLASLPLSIRARTHPHGILGTLILYGPLFDSLASFFMQEFTSQPRIGGRNWSSEEPTTKAPRAHDGVLWTAARVRTDFVLIKFGAPDFESAKEWLGELIRREGSVEREFGPEALGSL